MTLLEKIKQLCDEHGETFSSLEKKLGFGNATIRKWDDATPGGDRLSKVADYFNTSVDYLLGRETNELGGVYFNFAKEAQKHEIDPEDIKLAIDTIKRLRNK
nr:helix-turn-helix transcriptional regulator [uncultured Caproiciproducens sp.]